jgi:ABC-type transport system substrate-binding protein
MRRAISHAIDRQGLIEAVWGRGEPTSAVGRGLVEWALPVDQLGAGAKYYQYDPKEARRLLAGAWYPNGFKISSPSRLGWVATSSTMRS